MARLLLRTAVVAAIASWASICAAEHASVTLTYARQPAAKSCPDEATFRGLVAARLGYDAFVAAGATALSIDFRRQGNEVVGRLNLTGSNDPKRRQRTLRAGADECFELATSMALIAAVAVDPEAVRAQTGAPAPAEKPEAPPKPAAPPQKPPAPPEPAAAPAPPVEVDHFERGVRLELAALLPVGIVPAPRGGLRAGVAVDVGVWSLGAEGTWLFPSSRDNPDGAGEVSAYVLSGALVPCVHPLDSEAWLLNLCAVGSLGAVRSTASGVTRAEPAADLLGTVGPRAAAVVLLSRAFGLGASVDVPVTLSRVHLFIEEGGQSREVWAQSRVGFIGGVSLVARFR